MIKAKNKYALLGFLLLNMATISYSAEDRQEIIRQVIKDIATRCLDLTRPSPRQQLEQFQLKEGINQVEIKNVLLEYAEGRNLPNDYKSEISSFSLGVLADWKSAEIVPLLLDRATAEIDQKDEAARNARSTALSLLMRIGGSQALTVAVDVVSSPQNYSSLERFYVYENLAKHLQSTGQLDSDDHFRASVSQLFRDRLKVEKDIASVVTIDKALSSESAVYRQSKERANILEKHLENAAPYQKKYIEQSLESFDVKSDESEGTGSVTK